jgi:hypothetical protein
MIRRGLILLSSSHFGLDLLDLFHDTHDEVVLFVPNNWFERDGDGLFAALSGFADVMMMKLLVWLILGLALSPPTH